MQQIRGAPVLRQSFKKRSSKDPEKKNKEDEKGETGGRCGYEENLTDIE